MHSLGKTPAATPAQKQSQQFRQQPTPPTDIQQRQQRKGDENIKKEMIRQPPNSLPLRSDNLTITNTRSSSLEDHTDPDGRYLCAICINWLNEPVLTSCGHRFCKSCLSSWLGPERQWCPMDNEKISGEQDVFPDNFTRREIEQIKLKCPNANLGCDLVASPIEVERHRYNCPYRTNEDSAEEKCPFASIKCDFVARPETNGLEVHLKEEMALHMQLLLKAFQQTAISTWNPQKPKKIAAQTNGYTENLQLPPPPPQYANGAEEQLIQAMYQRIVVLEQRSCEQAVKIENLTKQLQNQRQQIDPRYSGGTILWEIVNFQKLIEHLRANANNLVYSRECFTSPYGYKFCARLNIQPKHQHLLSLHVHLMQSENDYHLDWPFNGRIKLCMIHPRDAKLSQHDTIMTKPEILAFHQPRERISTRGFGFVEYANVGEIIKKGFCEDDRLVIKIEINIV